jgi:hypothetical protein
MIEKNLEKLIVAAALTVAAPVLLPVAKSTLLPIAAAGYKSVRGLWNTGRSWAQIVKEEAEDIVAEAHFERMKKRLDREIAQG